jgi:hypothetical protein
LELQRPGFNVDNTTPTPYPATDGTAGAVGCKTGNFQGYGAGIWSVAGLGDFYDGKVFPNNDLVFLSKATLADQDGLIKALSGKTTNSPMLWTPLCQRTTNTEGCFIDPEMVDVEEETKAAYGMLRFGGDDMTIFNGVTVQGNVGLRFVQTKTTSSGGVAFPTDTWYTSAITTPCNAPLGQNSVTNISCWLTPDCRTSATAAARTTTSAASTTTGCPASTCGSG